MTRLEDNAELLKKAEELSKLHPSGTYEEMMSFQMGMIFAMLMDISRSLAVLADKAEREGEEC